MIGLFLFAGSIIFSYVVTKWIFGFSSYHRHFWWAGPFVAFEATAIAWGMVRLGLDLQFIYHLAIMIAFFVWWIRGNVAGVARVAASDELSPEERHFMVASGGRTTVFLILSSTTYVVAFSLAFMYFSAQSLTPPL